MASATITTTNKLAIGSNPVTSMRIGANPVRRIRLGSSLKYEVEDFSLTINGQPEVSSLGETISVSPYVTSTKTNVSGTDNVSYSPLSISVPANPTSAGRLLTYTITQGTSNLTESLQVYQLPGTSIVVNPDNITVGGSFTLTANKNWYIEYNQVQAYNYMTDTYTTLLDPVGVSPSAGVAGTHTISVTRGSWVDNHLVCLQPVCSERSAKVLIAPEWSSSIISSWTSPSGASTTQAVTSTNYPSVSYTSDSAWLTGSGNFISTTANPSTSQRVGHITATTYIDGIYFDDIRYSSSYSKVITVTQQAKQQHQDIYLYVVIRASMPSSFVLSTSSSSMESYDAPTNISVSADLWDENYNEYYCNVTINQGESSVPQPYSELQEISMISSSSVSPTTYTVGNITYHIDNQVHLI